jgi:excinuclease UvrABC nuclease subunit
MPARQLQLFKHAKPLLSTFGPAFFRTVPRAPGVYVMTGKSERVLYIGQSGNLRHRLATYKNCNPNQLSRRIIRMIHLVESISWETCESPLAAHLRENELLRLHRPKFNVMNVYPKAYVFIGLQAGRDELKLWLTREQTNDPGLYGAFKGMARDAFAALARSLYAALHQATSVHDFPCGILQNSRRFAVRNLRDGAAERLAPLLDEFFDGKSSRMIEWLEQSLPTSARLSPFQQQLHAADLLLLSDFFERGPRRNYHFRRENGLEERLILQEKLDDYIVMSRPDVMA